MKGKNTSHGETQRKRQYLRKGICKVNGDLLVILDAAHLLPLVSECFDTQSTH